VELANKVGSAEIISRVVEDLKDDNEQYRKMVMEAIEKVTRILCITKLLISTLFGKLSDNLIKDH